MADKIIYVKLKGQEQAMPVEGDTAEEDHNFDQLVVKDKSGKVVGRFQRDQVAGWWIQKL